MGANCANSPNYTTSCKYGRDGKRKPVAPRGHGGGTGNYPTPYRVRPTPYSLRYSLQYSLVPVPGLLSPWPAELWYCLTASLAIALLNTSTSVFCNMQSWWVWIFVVCVISISLEIGHNFSDCSGKYYPKLYTFQGFYILLVMLLRFCAFFKKRINLIKEMVKI